MKDHELLEKARQARKNSYSPYSKFAVGAALLCSDGTVYTGCNIENASYPAGMCAERTAVSKAVSEGHRDFTAIAISGGAAGEKTIAPSQTPCPPCGICRQVLREFVNPKIFRVILEGKIYTLEELLPDSFGPENLY